MPTSIANQSQTDADDILWRHLKSVPAFRALLRSVEARFYQQMEIAKPVLDLGCGDGHFASMAFGARLTAGIDPWWRPLKKAVRAGVYQLPVQSLGSAMPFPDGTFATVISNSVLEHIADVQPVLNEAARVLRPGGKLVVTFPNDRFTARLGGAQWLERIGLPGLAERYRRGFNTIARHAHTDPPQRWRERLENAGLVVEHWQPYFSVPALHALELGHYLGLPSFLCHLFTRRWIVAPWRSSLYLTERWLRPLFEEQLEAGQEGTMLIFVARKPEDPGRQGS
ncbi:MAG: methyltransferase domain-containing protein, partial [Chloroflexota bacterium]|jgi:SAM-dependent methyltransferase